MTLTIQVRPEKQDLLIEQARRAGLSTERYVERLVEETVPLPTTEAAEIYAAALRQTTDPHQRAERFVQRMRSLNPDAPALPLEAVSRESLYSRDDE